MLNSLILPFFEWCTYNDYIWLGPSSLPEDPLPKDEWEGAAASLSRPGHRHATLAEGVQVSTAGGKLLGEGTSEGTKSPGNTGRAQLVRGLLRAFLCEPARVITRR